MSYTILSIYKLTLLFTYIAHSIQNVHMCICTYICYRRYKIENYPNIKWIIISTNYTKNPENNYES